MRALRERRGLTQAELARLAHTTPPQIHRLENGQRKLTLEWAGRLAPHLAAAAEEILFPGLSRAAPGFSAPEAEPLPEPNADFTRIEAAPPPRAFQGPRDVPVKVPPWVRFGEPTRANSTDGGCSSTQCAAVTTHRGATSEPPQRCTPERFCRETTKL